MRGVPTIPCSVCGVDTLTGLCATHKAAQRRARRHPGYDDPVYRRYRKLRADRKDLCDNCNSRHGAILHHLDGDPGHNTPSNYAWLCKPCAEIADNEMRKIRADVAKVFDVPPSLLAQRARRSRGPYE